MGAYVEKVLQNILGGFTQASALDLLNLILGVTGVALMVRRNLWAFPVGLVAVTVQGVLFFRAKFYADGALQIFFFVTLAWGWRHWVRDRGAAPELPVSTLRVRERAAWVLGTAAVTALWATALQHWTDAVMPWRDALIAALQVTGQVLQARKNLENWAFLTAANLVAIPAYFSAELAFTAFLFAIYLVLGLLGWRGWRARFQAQRAQVVEEAPRA
jgi:nicotinamide mononucleotide transporter